MSSDFASSRARLVYWTWCAVAFLAFLTTAQLSYLSVLMMRAGYMPLHLGLILSAWSAPVIPSALLSGGLIRRFGAERVSVMGLALTLAGFWGLEFASLGLPAALAARVCQGAGFGLLAPAMIMAVKAQLGGARETYLLGIFSSTMMLPQLVSPSFAEFFLAWHGLRGFFLITSLPLVAALALAAGLARGTHGRAAPDAAGYFLLLADREIRPALVAVGATGALWGFASTLLAVLLTARGQSVGYFFTAFGATVLLTRFVIMRRIDLLSPEIAVGCALGLMGAAMAVVAATASSWALVAAAASFGLGYSVAYPRSIVWAANRYPSAARAKPIALINASFNAGGLVAPAVGGWFLSAGSLVGFAWALAAVGLALAIATARAGNETALGRP